MIGKILAEKRNTSVTNRSVLVLDLTRKDHVETGDGHHSLSAGILTNGIQVIERQNFTSKITSKDPMYESNVYVDGKTESTTKELSIGKTYYSASQELDEFSIEMRNPEAFSIARLRLSKPFVLISVGTDAPGGGSPIDITDQVLGVGIDVDSQQLDLRTTMSSIANDGNSEYEILLPNPVTVLRCVLRANRKDSYQFVRVVKQNNHGQEVKRYSIKDSLLLRRSIAIDVPEQYLRNLQRDANEGEIINQVEAAPYSNMAIVGIQLQSITSAIPSTNRLQRFVSGSQIKYVEIFVDAYDPESRIQYEVEADYGQKDGIHPVNSNGSIFRIEYNEKLPNYFNVNVTIPTGGSYNPILNGIVIRAGEKEI